MVKLIPEHYNIRLNVDLNKFRFNGETEIEMTSSDEVKEVKLNANDLAIWECKVITKDGYTSCPFSYNPKKEELTIELPDPRKEIKLEINYEGKINDLLVGLYRSKYVKDGKDYYVAVTQFEETDARRAFPCFDHPSKKATFDIEFIIDKDLTAIANTPISEEKMLDGGKKRVKFETTPRMCTYLLFFGIGDWEYIEKKTDDFTHRVVTTPGKTRYGDYALDFGLKCIEYGEKYTGVKYPISKMDQIAVPDFAFGAMENYGAITYRENLLLVYPGITSSAGLERIAEVIAHETAHQWFGNLVSPEDWKYIWLNESFATLFGYEITDFYHPEWQIWEGFLAGETNGAFERDSLIETFPIELPGGDYVVKINPATAPIIYNKGASILQMVRGYLGVDKFKKGIHAFLTKHQFDTANSDDYWSAFEEATGDPISKIMKSWVHQPGYPVVQVKREGDKLKINQKRFTFLPHTSDQVWIIPLTIACYTDGKEPTVLHEIMDDNSLTVTIPSDTKVFKMNVDQAGFYRVKYEKEELERLGSFISTKQLSAKDRFGLISDMYAFLRSGDYSIDDYLDFLKYYMNEDEYLPLTEINGSLIHAHDVIESRRDEIKSIGRGIFSNVLKKIGHEPVEGEPHKISNLRGSLLWSAFYFGDEDVKNFALSKFEDKKKGKDVHPDILRVIMRIGAAVSVDSYSWFIDKIESPETPETERINSLVAIASMNDKEVLRKVLKYVLEEVPNRNKIYPIMVIGRNLAITDELWSWYQENLTTLEKMHPMHYEQVITSIVSLAGLGREKEVNSFFTRYMEEKPQAKDTIKMTLERLAINSKLRNS